MGEMPSIKNIIKLKKKYDAPTIDELPTSYKTNTDKERLYLWAANNFHHQIQVAVQQFFSLFIFCEFLYQSSYQLRLPGEHLFWVEYSQTRL